MRNIISKTRKAWIAVTIWLSGFGCMCAMTQVIVLNDLYKVFADQAGLITASLSWPGVIGAVASLAAGVLMSRISTKRVILIGTALASFMGALTFVNSAPVLLLFTIFAGIGGGFLNAAGAALIVEVFDDEAALSRQMGYYNAAMALLGAGLSFVSGLMAVKGWRMAFVPNWLTIPILILCAIVLPDNRPAAAEENTGSQGNDRPFGLRFYAFCLTLALVNIAYTPVTSYISLVVEENGLGNSAFIGICSSLGTLSGFLLNLVFGFLYTKFSRKMALVIHLCAAAAYLWIGLVPSTFALVAGCIITGACYGTFLSLAFAYCAEIVPIEKSGLGMGVITFTSSFSVAIGIYIFDFLAARTSTYTGTLACAAGITALCILIEIIWRIRSGMESGERVI